MPADAYLWQNARRLDVSFTYLVSTTTASLPDEWDQLAHPNLFLSRNYLKVLEDSAPENMRCYFIGLYRGDSLAGIALCQFLDLSHVESFGDRDSCLKTKLRNIIFKRFSSKVLFIGNNMLTGQNAMAFAQGDSPATLIPVLQKAADELARTLKPHLVVWKDFNDDQSAWFGSGFSRYFKFQTQPNMIFSIPEGWDSFDDYLSALLKKYRDQYKRARKKAEGLDKRKMSTQEIEWLAPEIYALYRHVADKAPFNTFYLPQDHFSIFKKTMGDRFLFYGYFDKGRLVGFSTLIKNGKDIDTYFLGYEPNCQREKMLYLNMLYDMTAYSINKGYNRVIFARTALEIKSSVGAAPFNAWGFIKHRNAWVNRFMSRLFNYFEPHVEWQQRHPFKD